MDRLGDHQAKPAGIGVETFRRQHHEHRRFGLFEIRETEIRTRHGVVDASAIEKMGVALRRRQDAGRLALALAQMPVGRAAHQAAGSLAGLHGSQQVAKFLGRQGEQFTDAGEVAGGARFDSDDMEDQAGDQGLGFLVPVRLADLTGRIMHQGVGEQGGVLGEIQAMGIKTVDWVEGG